MRYEAAIRRDLIILVPGVIGALALIDAAVARSPDRDVISPDATRFLLTATRERGLHLVQVRPEYFPALSNESHSLWYDDRWVSSDVLLRLLSNLAPEDRGLAAGRVAMAAGQAATYREFPRDDAAR